MSILRLRESYLLTSRGDLSLADLVKRFVREDCSVEGQAIPSSCCSNMLILRSFTLLGLPVNLYRPTFSSLITLWFQRSTRDERHLESWLFLSFILLDCGCLQNVWFQ